jgi:hypothetical protein
MSQAAGKGRWKPARWRHPIGRWTKRVSDRLAKDQSPEWRLKMLENALAMTIRRNGPDSGPAARGRGLVAEQLEQMGRLTEARLLREEALAAHRRNVGDDDEQTLIAEAELALNMAKSGLREEAKVLYGHVYEVRLRILGPEHELTQRTERRLASWDSEDESKD